MVSAHCRGNRQFLQADLFRKFLMEKFFRAHERWLEL
jgi:hypothetical protein